MAAEIAYDTHPVRFDIGLNRMADIAKRVARLDRFDTFEQRVMRHLNQTVQPFGAIYPPHTCAKYRRTNRRR